MSRRKSETETDGSARTPEIPRYVAELSALLEEMGLFSRLSSFACSIWILRCSLETAFISLAPRTPPSLCSVDSRTPIGSSF